MIHNRDVYFVGLHFVKWAWWNILWAWTSFLYAIHHCRKLPNFLPCCMDPLAENQNFPFFIQILVFTSSIHSRSRFPCFASSQKKIRPALDKKLLAVSFVSIVSLAIWPSMAPMKAQTAKILIFDLEFSRLYFYEPAKVYLRDEIRKYLTNN